MRHSIFAGLAGIVSISSAFAGSPHPTAQDADGDGYWVPTMDVNADGVKDAKDIGVKQPDCDDKHDTVYPGAMEVVADGIDQDCNGKDLVLPISQAAWKLFVENEYGRSAPSAARFVYEHDQCLAASGKCTVDKNDGRFEVTDEGVQLKDIYVNGGKVLRNNGQKADGREIVTLEEIGHDRGHSASGGGGLGTKAVTKIAEDKAAAAIAPVVKEIESIRFGNADRDRKIEVLEGEDDKIAGLVGDEQTRAEEAERLLRQATEQAKADAVEALELAQKRGVLVEGYVLAGTMLGTPVNDPDGTVVREGAGFGGGGGINFGADIESGRVNVFADILVGADGGAGLAHSEAIGIESLNEGGLGGFLAYTSRASQANGLQTEAIGRAPLAGLSVAKPFASSGSKHGVFFARVGVGPELISADGDRVTEGIGFAGRLTIGIGWGIGALQQ